MKRTCGLVFTLGLTIVAAQGFAAPQNSQTNPGTQSGSSSQSSSASQGSQSARAAQGRPISVEIVSVDPRANTITVREITAVPSSSSSASSPRTLSVPSSATGQQLSQMRAGERVDVTCDVTPATDTAGRQVMLADCLRVTHIAPSNTTSGTSTNGTNTGSSK